jgi:hypothetical protein
MPGLNHLWKRCRSSAVILTAQMLTFEFISEGKTGLFSS